MGKAMKASVEEKIEKETLLNVLKNLNSLTISHEKIMNDPYISEEEKGQIDLLYKRYSSTFSAYLSNISQNESLEIQQTLQENQAVIDKIVAGVDKEEIRQVTQNTIEIDKSLATKYIVAHLNTPKLRSDLLGQKSLIANHMASHATGVQELISVSTGLIKADLDYVKQEYAKLTVGLTDDQIKNNVNAQSFKKLEFDLTKRLDDLDKYKGRTESLVSLTTEEKSELAKITRDQAARLKSLSTVFKGTDFEEQGNKLAVFNSFLTHDQTKLQSAAEAIYGDKAGEFLQELEQYKKGSDIIENKRVMKNLIGIAPEDIGGKAASNISDAKYDINKAYNDKASINIAPKERLNQFYAGVILNTTQFFQTDPSTKQKIFNEKGFQKWKQTIGITEAVAKTTSNVTELYSEASFVQQSKANKSKSKLTELERQAIESFTNGKKGEYLTDLDKKLVTSFCSYAIGNKELNKRLANVLISDDEFVRDNKEALSLLHKFTYKSSFQKEVTTSVTRLDNIVTQIEIDPETKFKDKEKITLHELGAIRKYMDIGEVTGFLKNKCQGFQTEKIKNLLTTHDKANKTMGIYNDIIVSNTRYEEGDLVMDVAKRYHEIELHNVKGFKAKLADIITPYSHAAIGTQISTKDQKQISGISEVWREYRHDKISENNALISKSFRIYPDKLIQNDQVKNEICKALGISESELKDKMQDLYKDISKELNNPDKLENADIVNDQKKREKAGKADFSIHGHKGKENIKEWAQGILKDKQNLGQNIKDSRGSNAIICSEFAAKMTVLALVELEKNLIDKIKEKNPEFEMPKKGLIKMPFDKHENLSKIHPARLVKELKKSRAIEKVQRAKVVKNTVMFR